MFIPRKRGAQPGNTNARVTGLGRTTIRRLTRKIILAADRSLFVCERCTKKASWEWPRHHKDRNRANNSPENLEVLCNDCHAREHAYDRPRTAKGTFSKCDIV